MSSTGVTRPASLPGAPSRRRRRHRRSITWSLGLIVVATVFALQSLASIVWLHEQFLGRVHALAEASVERALSARSLALSMPAAQRADLLEILGDSRTSFTLASEPATAEHRSWAHATQVLSELDLAGVPADTRLAIVVRRGEGAREQPRALLLSLPLEGRWLNVRFALDKATTGGELRGVFWTVMLSLLVTGTAIFAVARATRPLRSLARAAERLGQDLDAPPLEERGGRETVEAIGAFNRMQSSLQALLRDRIRMLGALSHDLRTQLTRLRLRVEAIPEPEQRRLARTELDTMAAMVDGVLDFARDDAADEAPRDLDLAALVRTLVDERADLGEAATYRGPDRLHYRGRRVALRRAVDNLLANALRYGGAADVVLEATKDERRSEVIELRIADPGPGIPPADRERVLEPFVRLDASRSAAGGGTGLGLSVSLAVVHLHGGTLEFVDATGAQGFTVVVRLPATS